MIARRTIPVSYINDLHQLFVMNYPMFGDFIPLMLKEGIYQLKGEDGKILSTKEALAALENGEEK